MATRQRSPCRRRHGLLFFDPALALGAARRIRSFLLHVRRGGRPLSEGAGIRGPTDSYARGGHRSLWRRVRGCSRGQAGESAESEGDTYEPALEPRQTQDRRDLVPSCPADANWRLLAGETSGVEKFCGPSIFGNGDRSGLDDMSGSKDMAVPQRPASTRSAHCDWPCGANPLAHHLGVTSQLGPICRPLSASKAAHHFVRHNARPNSRLAFQSIQCQHRTSPISASTPRSCLLLRRLGKPWRAAVLGPRAASPQSRCWCLRRSRSHPT